MNDEEQPIIVSKALGEPANWGNIPSQLFPSLAVSSCTGVVLSLIIELALLELLILISLMTVSWFLISGGNNYRFFSMFKHYRPWIQDLSELPPLVKLPEDSES